MATPNPLGIIELSGKGKEISSCLNMVQDDAVDSAKAETSASSETNNDKPTTTDWREKVDLSHVTD